MRRGGFEEKSAMFSAYINAHIDIVDFGTANEAPSQEWIENAEARIGFSLPQSYKWFLENYGGGEICGEEIFSIYGRPFDTVNGGDIVFHYINDVATDDRNATRLRISSTDYGERFFFDYKRFDGIEAPVCLALGKEIVDYADDFFGYLLKRIEAYA